MGRHRGGGLAILRFPRIRIKRRQSEKYASVDIDLWPCGYNLTSEGIEACRALLLDAARRAKDWKGIGPISARKTGVAADRVLVEDAEPLAERLLDIIRDPAYLERV